VTVTVVAESWASIAVAALDGTVAEHVTGAVGLVGAVDVDLTAVSLVSVGHVTIVDLVLVDSGAVDVESSHVTEVAS